MIPANQNEYMCDVFWHVDVLAGDNISIQGDYNEKCSSHSIV